ncbi:MAG: hypothetical protein ABIO63_11905 [Casimicrobiaceae bacterium]
MATTLQPLTYQVSAVCSICGEQIPHSLPRLTLEGEPRNTLLMLDGKRQKLVARPDICAQEINGKRVLSIPVYGFVDRE